MPKSEIPPPSTSLNAPALKVHAPANDSKSWTGANEHQQQTLQLKSCSPHRHPLITSTGQSESLHHQAAMDLLLIPSTVFWSLSFPWDPPPTKGLPDGRSLWLPPLNFHHLILLMLGHLHGVKTHECCTYPILPSSYLPSLPPPLGLPDGSSQWLAAAKSSSSSSSDAGPPSWSWNTWMCIWVLHKSIAYKKRGIVLMLSVSYQY